MCGDPVYPNVSGLRGVPEAVESGTGRTHARARVLSYSLKERLVRLGNTFGHRSTDLRLQGCVGTVVAAKCVSFDRDLYLYWLELYW